MVSNGGDKAKTEGDASVETGRALKKGPWTAAEDGILIEYVKKQGEGNWNAVQKHTGLARCGKSCRLRWANHLRPNLKKGSFSQEEERVIIELHAKLGNKWARMAAQLPGRTDNEIKNYWNTRMKRRQRAGLPLYPLELQQEATTFHLRHGGNHHSHRHSSSSSPSFSTLLSPQSPNPSSLSLFNFSSSINTPHKNFTDSSFYPSPTTTQFKFLSENNNNAHFTPLPLSPVSPFTQSLQISYGSYVCNSGLGAPYPQMIHPGLELELPSIQTPPNYSTTPASSGTSGTGDGMMGANSSNVNDESVGRDSIIMKQGNSGLLDALLLEAEALSRNEKFYSKDENESSSAAEFDGGKQTGEENHDHSDEFSSSHSSTRKRPRMDPLEGIDSMDDDLMSLLNNFPSTMPMPEWYPGGDNDGVTGNTNKRQSLYESNGNPDADEQHENASASPLAVALPALDWSRGSSCWNNMPSIC